jgi:hypothetical protein
MLILFILLAIGGTFFIDNLNWRLRGQRVTGTLVDVRIVQMKYVSVYQYTDALGQSRQASSLFATVNFNSRRMGSSRRLLVLPGHPYTAREANSFMMDLGSTLFLAFPLWVTYVMGRQWHWSPQSVIALAVCAVVAGTVTGRWLPAVSRGWARSPPQSTMQGQAAPAAAAEPGAQVPTPVAAGPAASIGVQRAAAPWSAGALRAMRVAGAIWLMIAALIVISGIWGGWDTLRLATMGLRTSGTIVRVEQRTLNSRLFSHAIVRFNTVEGVPVEVRDSYARGPRFEQVGRQVSILYLADNPRTVLINPGASDWMLPLAGVAAGLVQALLALALLVARPAAPIVFASPQGAVAPGELPPPAPAPPAAAAPLVLGQPPVSMPAHVPLGSRLLYRTWVIIVLYLLDAWLVAPGGRLTGAAAAGAILFPAVAVLGVCFIVLRLLGAIASAQSRGRLSEALAADMPLPGVADGTLMHAPAGRSRALGIMTAVLHVLWVMVVALAVLSIALLVRGKFAVS